MQLLNAADYVSMPWANGRGTTLEIARFPATGQWQWRLSLATVSEDGPFSVMPGVQRSLVVAKGAGMGLTVAGQHIEVGEFGMVQFVGDDDTSCALVDGPVQDLNLMVRDDARVGTFSVVALDRGEPLVVTGTDCVVAVTVLRGSVTATTNAGPVPKMIIAHDRDTVLFDRSPSARDPAVTMSSSRGATVAVSTVRERQ